ncbi:tyrosine-type recombinase/integrase [Paraburkholderia sp. J67]|uniref:tyrosine-type recombinase/integrase n=1 Tax=Paraburkholderia sp. J67 TaxID=2805435 RepID=UPI002ABD3D10|nr:tyrosine-type recombinase/integrase [Paraburkholderia sp. J67]
MLLHPANYLDLATDPPRPLPDDIPGAVAYLSTVLSQPVFETWTPARLLQSYGSMPAAKAAQPEVFSLLLQAACAVQYWDLGQIRTVAANQAPDAEAVVSKLLRTLRVRFRLAQPSPAPGQPAAKPPGAAAIRPDLRPATLPVADEPWLRGRGLFFNSDPSTNVLGLSDDQAAVRRFLQERASSSPHTMRAYMFELRRLIRWCEANGVRGPLSSLTRAVLLDYRDALRRRGAAQAEQGSEERSEAGQQRGLAVLRSLYGFLSSTGYLTSNPCARLGDGVAARARFHPERILPDRAVQAIDHWLRQRLHDTGQGPDGMRCAAAVATLRFTGIRLDELASRNGYPRVSIDAAGWTLTVMGKGRKRRSVPVPDICTRFLKQYRIACGLPATPPPGEVEPLIRGKRGAGLGPSGLYRVVKAALREMACSMPESEVAARLVLASASPHWLRHLMAKTLVIDRKVPLPMAAALLGHGSVVTTAGYAQSDLSELREIMEGSFTLQSVADTPQPDHSVTQVQG